MRLYPYKWVLLVLCSLAVNVGCAVKSENQLTPAQAELAEERSRLHSQFTEAHLDLIATDMASVIIQIPEFNPLSTTMQYSKPVNKLGEQLIDKLQQAGYGMQEVSADQGIHYIGYQTRSIQVNNEMVTDILVKIAGVEVRREYSVAEGHVIPTSVVYVSGTDSFDNIALNENLFLQQSETIRFVSGVEIELLDSTVVTTLPRDVGAGSNTESTGSKENAILEARGNSLNSGSDAVLASRSDYQNLVRALVRFEVDILTVGRTNKAVIKKVLEDFDESKDAIFISSCAGVGGDKNQALRRSSRTKEELVLSGVPINLIVEEGCVESNYPRSTIEPNTVVLMHSRIGENRQVAKEDSLLRFPNRPLIMTIPYGAGGATDYQARIVTMAANDKEHLGQPIQIMNKTGQGGRAGWSWFAENAKDTGYDLASYNVPHFIAQSIKYETSYNIDTLEPIANWGADPAVLVVSMNSPFNNVADLVAYARANPGKLTVSGAGRFVGHHIALLQLEKAAKIKSEYVTGNGGAAALQQVVDGEVMAGFNNMSDAFRAGSQVRILAIADLKRNEIIPSIPTFLELALNIDDSSVNFRGLMVPKGTPPAVIDLLSTAALKMFNNETVVNRMKAIGAQLLIMDRDEVRSLWAKRRVELAVLLRGL